MEKPRDLIDAFNEGRNGRKEEQKNARGRPCEEPLMGISRVKPIFWCHSGLFQKLLTFSGY
ncbi:hypothetical protein CXB51_010247 [Gossypium anomalum]|uniref:Uncharacterized protein n=1 Tax=Gossypium anomalum TaxID=47600 RepID=A0A8J5ZN78_9ROSI|nr:hypothetical protein CXB51_010247 [Gossypium anomalum]